MDQLNMNLYENGIDFIERSIESYLQAKDNSNEYKYAVMFLGIGSELILKSILEAEHPLFVLDSLDGKVNNTIASNKIIDRLKLVFDKKGRSIKEADVKNLESIRTVRNSILHRDVHFHDEPINIFTSTLYSLDTMVKLFSNNTKTLASTLKNWKLIVDDDKIREKYHQRIKGFRLGNFTVPCSFCSLETIVAVKNSNSFVCKHCSFVYNDIFHLLEEIEVEPIILEDILVAYIDQLLVKPSPDFVEVIKAINSLKTYSFKNVNMNKLVDYVIAKNKTVYQCPECNAHDFLFYDSNTERMLCVKCGKIELEECDSCQKHTFISDGEGYEYCYLCQENTRGVQCSFCYEDDFSYPETIIVDIKNKKIFEKNFDYEINDPPFMKGKCCPECRSILYKLEEENIIAIAR